MSRLSRYYFSPHMRSAESAENSPLDDGAPRTVQVVVTRPSGPAAVQAVLRDSYQEQAHVTCRWLPEGPVAHVLVALATACGGWQ